MIPLSSRPSLETTTYSNCSRPHSSHLRPPTLKRQLSLICALALCAIGCSSSFLGVRPAVTAQSPAKLFGIGFHVLTMVADESAASVPPQPTSSDTSNMNERRSPTSPDESPESQPTLLLPPNDSNDATIPRIQLGDTISFEEMGPVIINADGSTRRIDNWDKMTKHEQEVAWRRIAKRNQARREALLHQQRLLEEKETESKRED